MVGGVDMDCVAALLEAEGSVDNEAFCAACRFEVIRMRRTERRRRMDAPIPRSGWIKAIFSR